MQPRAALRRAVAGARRAMFAVAIFSIVLNLLMLTVPIYMMQMYDRVLPTRHTDTLLLLSLMALVALMVMAAMEVVRSRIMVRLGTWIDRQLSGPLLMVSMVESLRRSGAGIQAASALRELNTLRQFVTGPGVFPLLDAPWVPIYIAIIFFLHPLLGWLSIAGAVVVFLFAVANDLLTRPALSRASRGINQSLYRADAAVRNADVIEALGMGPAVVDKWRSAGEVGLGYQADASDASGLISAVARMMRLVVQIGILGAGAYLVILGELTGGGMIGASIILGRAMAPIEQSINAWRGFTGARNAFRSIRGLIERQEDEGEPMSLPEPKGQVSVEGVTFVPPGQREPVLRQVSFEVRPGEQVGLVGPSASGKTTLARLLVGSWLPTAGTVRLDGADLAYWHANDRGRHIGYVPQDVELFDGTVRENIARLTDCEPEEIVAAARLARVHEMILRLPDGYDTQMGEGGVWLSGGQRQRIAMARAVFGQPKFLVLDEPNANLDREGDMALLETLKELKAMGSTVIIVSHRPSVLSFVDSVIVLNQGRLEAKGPRDEVLAKLMPGGGAQAQIASPPGSAPQGEPAPARPAARGNGSGGVSVQPLSPGADSRIRIRPGAAEPNAVAPDAVPPAAKGEG
ncbi:MAG: type I secretion system permease/ATPase [Alphaproteobacteria bacterium]|nr:type I secretion system permease/ATPase [Alphaproteobacteria bacterium]MCB9928090.1 type I secretion system permease/ATPase [Alphaproteobacteria bacterium]